MRKLSPPTGHLNPATLSLSPRKQLVGCNVSLDLRASKAEPTGLQVSGVGDVQLRPHAIGPFCALPIRRCWWMAVRARIIRNPVTRAL
jgi:hypothetical protein